MQCPKCDYVRSAADAVVPDWQCPKCGIVYAKFNRPGSKCVRLSLVSGEKIEFDEIKLYDSDLFRKLDDLLRTIDRNHRGFSTGIGAIGSLEDVIVTKLVTGAVDGIVSGAMAAAGEKQLTEAMALAKQLRDSGPFVKVSAVENIEYPQMELWRVPRFKSGNKHELIQIPSQYITIKKDANDVRIFWDKVEQYSCL